MAMEDLVLLLVGVIFFKLNYLFLFLKKFKGCATNVAELIQQDFKSPKSKL